MQFYNVDIGVQNTNHCRKHPFCDRILTVSWTVYVRVFCDHHIVWLREACKEWDSRIGHSLLDPQKVQYIFSSVGIGSLSLSRWYIIFCYIRTYIIYTYNDIISLSKKVETFWNWYHFADSSYANIMVFLSSFQEICWPGYLQACQATSVHFHRIVCCVYLLCGVWFCLWKVWPELRLLLVRPTGRCCWLPRLGVFAYFMMHFFWQVDASRLTHFHA